jgi:hypothetical protein
MLPTYTALFEAHRWLCLTRRIRYGEHELHEAQIAIARARLLAATLAAGNEDDEPPALHPAFDAARAFVAERLQRRG